MSQLKEPEFRKNSEIADNQFTCWEIERSRAGTRVNSLPQATVHTSNLFNQIATQNPSPGTIIYDPRGNLSQFGSTRAFTHDPAGRLTATTINGNTVNYVYDLQGRLTLRTAPDGSKTRYYYTSPGVGSPPLLVKEKPAGQTTWKTKYVYRTKGDALGATYHRRSYDYVTRAASDKWYAYDPLVGNVVAEVTTPNTTAATVEMEAFGNTLTGGQSGHRLTGKEYDADAQLYYFGARWYDPQTGRWIEPEPTGADGPNLYHFVFQNPAGLVDLSGLQALPPGYEPFNYFDPNLVSDAGIYGDAALQTGGEIVVQAAVGRGLGLSGRLFSWLRRLTGMGGGQKAAQACSAGASRAGGAGEHIALGIRSEGLAKTAEAIGAKHLLHDPSWRSTLQSAIANPTTKFTISVDGFAGSRPN